MRARPHHLRPGITTARVARVTERLLRDPDAPRHGRVALQAYVDRGVVGWWRFLCPVLAAIGRVASPTRTAMDEA